MRTNRMIMYNMPSFFEGIYKVIQQYLNEKIRSKVIFNAVTSNMYI